MFFKNSTEKTAIEMTKRDVQPVATLKKIKSYFRNLFRDKPAHSKKQSSQEKVVGDVEKGTETVNAAELDKTNLAESIRKANDCSQSIVSSIEKSLKPVDHKRVLQQQAAFKAESKVLDSLVFSSTEADYKPSQQELDAFRMKAISLLKRSGMLPEVISEVLCAPVKVNIGEIDQDNDKHLMIKLSQRFTRLGQEFQFEGMFLKKAKLNSAHSIPISGSFQISLLSKNPENIP
ncbi:hypothetical protein PHSC3_000288 [Chlamydiales bacterium STE3]|nr:hypothetical protein PHSC3_000288 [Chlamydiales bacterium STE3]